MSTATRALVRPRSGASVSTRLVEFASRTSVHLALVVISVIWLVPTFGLLVTSFRTRSDILSTGWWNAFIEWRFTPENYLRVLSSSGATDSLGLNFLNSIIITVPSTFLPVLVASLAAYAFALPRSITAPCGKLWARWCAWAGGACHASFGLTAARIAVGARSTFCIRVVIGSLRSCFAPSSNGRWFTARGEWWA